MSIQYEYTWTIKLHKSIDHHEWQVQVRDKFGKLNEEKTYYSLGDSESDRKGAVNSIERIVKSLGGIKKVKILRDALKKNEYEKILSKFGER